MSNSKLNLVALNNTFICKPNLVENKTKKGIHIPVGANMEDKLAALDDTPTSKVLSICPVASQSTGIKVGDNVYIDWNNTKTIGIKVDGVPYFSISVFSIIGKKEGVSSAEEIIPGVMEEETLRS